MFSSYPTTTVLPTRRAQTPPISSLPTSPSDEVGRRQSLTSPDSQSARPANRTGVCAVMHYDTQTSWHSWYWYLKTWALCFFLIEGRTVILIKGAICPIKLNCLFYFEAVDWIMATWERNGVLYISHIRPFLFSNIGIFSAVNFPWALLLLQPTHIEMLCFHFHSVKVLSIYHGYLFWEIGSFGSMLFCLQIFRNFPNVSLLLISNLMSLLSENMSCIIWILLNLLRLALWPRVWSVLINIQCALGKNVYYAIVEWSVL